MHIFRNPSWIDNFLFNSISEESINAINDNLDRHNGIVPVISIIIPVFNEGLNILNCIASLAANKCNEPFEIIVVDNNSTDNTKEIVQRLNVRYLFESKVGPGAARQLGQENARGNYILTADGDCIYPSLWIISLYNALKIDGVTCVYGKYSFLGSAQSPRWQLFIYEKMKDVLSEIRHLKRPHLNCLGMSMGYPKALGLEIGFDTRNIILDDGRISFVRGEDGRMCFDLSQKGRVIQIRSSKARLWTIQRTLEKEGSLWKSFFIRIKRESKKFKSYFTSHPPHDTKQSL